MSNDVINQLEVEINGVLKTFDIQDEGARELIAALGNALYWVGVTTTELVDNVTTTNTITVNSESVQVHNGAIAQYSGEEFAYDGTVWQSLGKNNFGNLAFKNSASGNFTPQGSVAAPTISVLGGTTDNITPVTAVGTLPSWSVSNGKATFNPGTLPTQGTAKTVVTSVGTITASAPAFTGTEGSVTVS